MDYTVIETAVKPDKAPDKFCVYKFKGEEYVFCPIRKKLYKAKPEEKVRQWWIYRLKEVYGYSFSQISVEVKVIVGSTEADPLHGKLSNETPLAKAILDHKPGDVVTVNVKSPYEVKIVKKK